MDTRPEGWWKKKFVKVKAWTVGQKGEPYFPKEFELVTSDILQWTDMISNHNKYYSIELHTAEEKGKQYFRLYTHYGRTDDLESNRDAGKKETRHYKNLEETEAAYGAIMDEKTRKKGYNKVDMASANIGSDKARARNDSKKEKEPDFASAFLLQQANQPEAAESSLHPKVAAMVSYIYSEATSRLTATVSAKITERGIETPLGVLNLSQVLKGEAIIDQMASLHADGKLDRQAAERLSSEFYTVIPHRIGRSKSEVMSAVMMTPEAFDMKRELLQLMKDMLQVNESGGVLFSSAIDNKYKALRCEISLLEATDPLKYHEVKQHVLDSQVKSRDIEILNIFGLKRESEHQQFTHNITPQELLFHGSRISNWVGLLSRGLLMPKSVVSLGGKRTDYGLLGAGLYFGGNSCTSAQYATAGQKGTRFLLLNNVALGRICKLYKITSHLEAAPDGYDSVHGVSSRHGTPSDFKDDEFVVYYPGQQRQEYLIEFRSISQDPPASTVDGSSSLFAPQLTFQMPSAVAASPAKKVAAFDFKVPASKSPAKKLFDSEDDDCEDEKPTKKAFAKPAFSMKAASPAKKAVPKKKAYSESESDDDDGSEEEMTPKKSVFKKTAKKSPVKAMKKTAKKCSASESDEGDDGSAEEKHASPKKIARKADFKKMPMKKSPAKAMKKPAAKKEAKYSASESDDDSEEEKHASPKKMARKADFKKMPMKKTAKKFSASEGEEDDDGSAEEKLSPMVAKRKATTEMGDFVRISPHSPPIFGSFGSREKEKEKEPRAAATSAPAAAGSIYSNYDQYITSEQRELKQKEDRWRELFATDPTNSELRDPVLGLIDIFSNRGQFLFEEETHGEKQIPKVLDQFVSEDMESRYGTPSVVTRDKWEKNWEDFTTGQLRGLNWSNIFVAGGSVLATLDPSYPDITKGSDIDLFIYGLDENQAREKLRHVFNTVQTNTNGKGDIIRTKNAITIIGSFPYHHIQIIMRLYKSPAEVLMGFDIDSCTVGYDGKTVWALERAKRAINKRYNLVDLSRRSLTYETRLNKYAKRGFAVAVPGFSWDRVDHSLYTKGVRSVRGLAKLLVMHHAAMKATKNGAPTPKKRSPVRRGKKGATAENEEGEESDYTDVEIPWGPEWVSTGIVQLLNQKDRAQFFSQIRQNKAKDERKHVSHIFVSGIDAVLNDTTRMGPLSWLKDNPGRQLLTGSFHPVDDAHWDTDAYGPSGGSSSAASATSSFSSLFGATAPSASSFSMQSNPAFGSATSSFGASASTSSFSASPTPAHSFGSSTSLFGATAPSSSFGSTASSTSFFGAPASSFGSTAPSTSLFGAPAASSFGSTAAPATSFGSLFAAPSAKASFGGFAETKEAKPSGKAPRKAKAYVKKPASPTKKMAKPAKKECAPKKAMPAKKAPPKKMEKPAKKECAPKTKAMAAKKSCVAPPRKEEKCTPKKKAMAKKASPKKMEKIMSPKKAAVPKHLFFQEDIEEDDDDDKENQPSPSIFMGKAQPKEQAMHPILPSGFGSFDPRAAALTAFCPPSLPDASTASGDREAVDTLKRVFQLDKPPASARAKLLLVISVLSKGGKLSEGEKSYLKDLTISADQSLLWALEAFEFEHDWEELEDSLHRLCKLNGHF